MPEMTSPEPQPTPDSPDSWVCQFENAGFEVCPIIKGLGEYPGIRRMYVEHAQKAIDSIK